MNASSPATSTKLFAKSPLQMTAKENGIVLMALIREYCAEQLAAKQAKATRKPQA